MYKPRFPQPSASDETLLGKDALTSEIARGRLWCTLPAGYSYQRATNGQKGDKRGRGCVSPTVRIPRPPRPLRLLGLPGSPRQPWPPRPPRSPPKPPPPPYWSTLPTSLLFRRAMHKNTYEAFLISHLHLHPNRRGPEATSTQLISHQGLLALLFSYLLLLVQSSASPKCMIQSYIQPPQI